MNAPRFSSLAAALAAALGLGAFGATPGCSESPSSDETSTQELVPQRPAGLVPESLAAGLVAITDTSKSGIDVGSGSVVVSDWILANGDVSFDGPDTEVRATVRARGDVKLGRDVRLDGNLVCGGALERRRGAVVTGIVQQGAAVDPFVYPPATELASRVGGWTGSAMQPAIRVRGGRVHKLAEGGYRVGDLTVEHDATLVVESPVAIEVRDRVDLGSGAKIVVRGPKGRLLLFVRKKMDLSHDAAIVQENGPRGRALALFFAADAKLDWAPDVRFGPGLLYAPALAPDHPNGEAVIRHLSSFEGTLVAPRVETAPHAHLKFDGRFLGCFLDDKPPQVAITAPARGTEVSPGTRTVDVSGSVQDDSLVETVKLTDANGTRRISLGRAGTFRERAQLRRDGEPSRVCVRARDCAGHETETCVDLPVASDLDFLVTSPASGAVLAQDRVTVSGRVTRGQLAAVQIGSRTGRIMGDRFAITDVPLAPGANVLLVRGTSTTGSVVVRRVLVSSGPLRVLPLELAVDANRQITIAQRYPALQVGNVGVAGGHIRYRLRDAGGMELHRGTVPNTAPSIEHVVFPDGTQVSAEPQRPFHAFLLAPDIPQATTAEFVDEVGRSLGVVNLR